MTRKTQLKLIANGNVLSWSMFWVFGFLAVTTPSEAQGLMVGAAVLSFIGLGLGVWCYLQLIRQIDHKGS